MNKNIDCYWKIVRHNYYESSRKNNDDNKSLIYKLRFYRVYIASVGRKTNEQNSQKISLQNYKDSLIVLLRKDYSICIIILHFYIKYQNSKSTSKQLSEIKRMVLIKDFPFFKEIKYFSSISHKITIIQD